MLTTIIYRSHICDDVPVKALETMVAAADSKNRQFDVTGILLFNGTHFFQLLEGPVENVTAIYEQICRDPRHHNVVELMRDHGPSRRFGNVGMELFDLRHFDREDVLQQVLNKGTTRYQLTYNDRPLQFFRTTAGGSKRGGLQLCISADCGSLYAGGGLLGSTAAHAIRRLATGLFCGASA